MRARTACLRFIAMVFAADQLQASDLVHKGAFRLLPGACADPHHRRTPDVEGSRHRLLRDARVGLQEPMGTGQGAGCQPPLLGQGP